MVSSPLCCPTMVCDGEVFSSKHLNPQQCSHGWFSQTVHGCSHGVAAWVMVVGSWMLGVSLYFLVLLFYMGWVVVFGFGC